MASNSTGYNLSIEESSLVNIWDMSSYEVVESLQGHTTIVTALAWNLDGTLLASGDANGKIIVWGQ